MTGEDESAERKGGGDRSKKIIITLTHSPFSTGMSGI